MNKKMANMVKTIMRGLFKLIYGRVNFDNNINYSTITSELDKYNNKAKSNQRYFLYSSDNCRIYTDLNENVAVIKDGKIFQIGKIEDKAKEIFDAKSLIVLPVPPLPLKVICFFPTSSNHDCCNVSVAILSIFTLSNSVGSIFLNKSDLLIMS